MYIGRIPTSVPLSANDVPDLPASKITSGQFSNSLISASSVSQHATSFDDNKIVNDLSTLGLRVHTQENLNVSSTNSTSFDVFNDSSGVASFTTCSRDSSLEHVSTKIFGSSSLIDFDSMDGSGEYVEYKATSNLASGLATSFTDLTDNNITYVDAKYVLDNHWSGVGRHWGVLSQVPRDNTDRDDYHITFDFKDTYEFSGVWYIGKVNGYGDLRKVRLQSSSDDNTYTNIDMSGVSVTQVQRSNGSPSGTEGQFSSGSSDGTFILNKHATEYHATMNTLGNFPATEMRYLRFIFMNQHTGSSNTNAGFSFNITRKPITFSATGNFVGANITAPSTISKMGAVITYTETGTNTLNTDIVMQLSSDGGSNFTTATLTPLPDFSTGIKMAKINDLSLTGGTGTSLTYKISFANQSNGVKLANIKGVSLQY